MKIIRFNGGLGNQMFQYALYLSLKNKGYKVYGDLSFFRIKKEHNGYELNKIFGVLIDEKYNEIYKFFLETNMIVIKILRMILRVIFKERYVYQKDTVFSKELLINSKIKVYSGCWQSEKFFLEIKDQIYRDFKFSKFNEKENILIEKKIKEVNSVSIHVRRGDYLNYKNIYAEVTKNYYQNAIDYIEKRIEEPVFFIFSDDIKWCKKNLKLKGIFYYIDWNKNEKSYRDMQLMSLCKNNIIANSTFSWWGAWLNKNENKIVIAPQNWYLIGSKLNDQDIIPLNWKKIEN